MLKQYEWGILKMMLRPRFARIILKALAESCLARNATIKGGVVMRCKTGNVRRATQDLDIDFIKYSLKNESIDVFIRQLNSLTDIEIERVGDIEELKQQDYSGKRVIVKIKDKYGYGINTKIDLGVHNRFELEQEEYCFDIAYGDGVSLLINSSEQMFVEKLRSLLRFGPLSTRYKDIYDMYYLKSQIDMEKFKVALNSYILEDNGMKEKHINDIVKKLSITFTNKRYRSRVDRSDKRWIDESIDVILSGILNFISSAK